MLPIVNQLVDSAAKCHHAFEALPKEEQQKHMIKWLKLGVLTSIVKVLKFCEECGWKDALHTYHEKEEEPLALDGDPMDVLKKSVAEFAELAPQTVCALPQIPPRTTYTVINPSPQGGWEEEIIPEDIAKTHYEGALADAAYGLVQLAQTLSSGSESNGYAWLIPIFDKFKATVSKDILDNYTDFTENVRNMIREHGDRYDPWSKEHFGENHTVCRVCGQTRLLWGDICDYKYTPHCIHYHEERHGKLLARFTQQLEILRDLPRAIRWRRFRRPRRYRARA